MLGNATLRLFLQSRQYDTWGSVRSTSARQCLPPTVRDRVVCGVDAENIDSVARLIAHVQPNVVINCIGLVKQIAAANNHISAININALLPHRLARLCQVAAARFVHISTDCVFAGTKGMYRESDYADAHDLYGRSKYLGEVDYANAVTLRTSIIGQQLGSAHGLIGWFLGQDGPVKGFTRAIFSGLPTVELARVIRDHLVPHIELRGLYHVSSAPISKYDLLCLVARIYGKAIEITPDDALVIDRSLDSTRFRSLVGYDPLPWPDLVRAMHAFA